LPCRRAGVAFRVAATGPPILPGNTSGMSAQRGRDQAQIAPIPRFLIGFSPGRTSLCCFFVTRGSGRKATKTRSRPDPSDGALSNRRRRRGMGPARRSDVRRLVREECAECPTPGGNPKDPRSDEREKQATEFLLPKPARTRFAGEGRLRC